MYQKEYMLRMIEMAARMIAAILGLIKGGRYEEAVRDLNDSYDTFLHEDSAFFRSIPADMLTDKLLSEHNYTNGHLEILAELMNAEAELELSQGNRSGSLEFSERSLLLLEFIDRDQKTYSTERQEKMETIQRRIEELTT